MPNHARPLFLSLSCWFGCRQLAGRAPGLNPWDQRWMERVQDTLPQGRRTASPTPHSAGVARFHPPCFDKSEGVVLVKR